MQTACLCVLVFSLLDLENWGSVSISSVSSKFGVYLFLLLYLYILVNGASCVIGLNVLLPHLEEHKSMWWATIPS